MSKIRNSVQQCSGGPSGRVSSPKALYADDSWLEFALVLPERFHSWSQRNNLAGLNTRGSCSGELTPPNHPNHQPSVHTLCNGKRDEKFSFGGGGGVRLLTYIGLSDVAPCAHRTLLHASLSGAVVNKFGNCFCHHRFDLDRVRWFL